ncbi:MAG: hypothetical protein L6R39_006090 [Caloplaca ligustica]|nr:MAG: hypothetical protein L6R39_006090 [Caloplaca ligustica]
MDPSQSNENRDMTSASPAEPTPGRTPNGTLPPLRRRRPNADPLRRPKDRNKKPPPNPRPNVVGHAAQSDGLAPGRTQAMPHHPGRPSTAAPQRRSTPDVNREPEPVSGFSSAPLGPVTDIPLVTTKASLMEGLRHHVARFTSKRPVDPRNADEFTRPVRLHRRDPRIPVPGKDDLNGEGAENNGPIDDKEKEVQDALKAEKKRQRELNLAQIAPTANASGQRKNPYGKKTQQIYRNDQTPEQKARSRLRYEEAMPWHLEDFDNKSTWVGTYEAALSDTNVILVRGTDGKFRMVPVEKWYKFTSKQQFKILSIDEAEKAMDKKVTQPRWFMDTQKAGRAQESEGAAARGLYLGKFEAPVGKATARSRAPKADPDADDLDFEEDRFADDEENPYLEGPEEENKEIEEKVKRDQLRANFFDNKDEKEVDEEEEAQKKEKELEKAFGKSYKKALMKKEKNFTYDSDSDHPYSEKSESENSETERRKEEERKKEEEAKGNASDREKTQPGKGSKNPSGANTPSGRPSKHPISLKKTGSSNNLKRPGSANASDASGNESTRKKRKPNHLTPAAATGPSTLKPPSRPMSPDYAPPSSAPQRAAPPAAADQANNKRPRADAGSGSEKSGGEMSDGKRKKQKLKLRMSASPDRSPNGSRAVSPEVKTEKPNGAAAGGGTKAASPPAAPAAVSSFDITAEEVRGLIPPEGISISKLVKKFAGRITKENMGPFKRLMFSVSRYDKASAKFHPLPETPDPGTKTNEDPRQRARRKLTTDDRSSSDDDSKKPDVEELRKRRAEFYTSAPEERRRIGTEKEMAERDILRRSTSVRVPSTKKPEVTVREVRRSHSSERRRRRSRREDARRAPEPEYIDVYSSRPPTSKPPSLQRSKTTATAPRSRPKEVRRGSDDLVRSRVERRESRHEERETIRRRTVTITHEPEAPDRSRSLRSRPPVTSSGIVIRFAPKAISPPQPDHDSQSAASRANPRRSPRARTTNTANKPKTVRLLRFHSGDRQTASTTGKASRMPHLPLPAPNLPDRPPPLRASHVPHLPPPHLYPLPH